MNSTLLNRILMVLGFAGIFISGSLTLKHLGSLEMPCGASNPCERVLTHSTAKVGPIPVAALGLLAYIALTVLAAMRASSPPDKVQPLVKAGLLLSGLGAGISIYYQYVALGVIKATCTWCLSSAAVMILTFIASYLLSKKPWEESSDRTDSTVLMVSSVVAAVSILTVYMTMVQARKDGGISISGINEVKLTDLVEFPDKYTFGDPKAPITVVEFADFNCPGCRTSYPRVHDLVQQPQFKGKIRLIYRHFPFSHKEGHETSDLAAYAAEFAAEQGRYYQMVDYLFATKDGEIQTIPGLMNAVKSAGFDVEEFRKRLAEKDMKLLEAVEGDKLRAQKFGLDMTPTFFVFAPGVKTRSTDMGSIETVLNGPEYKKIYDN
jgi:protein-disulfide isomerase